MRGVRRLGAVARPEGGVRWVGFAGLGRTVVERLLAEDEAVGTRDDDALAAHLADMRHVMGGGCAAGGSYEAAVGAMAAELTAFEARVSHAGGGDSELRRVITSALSCVDGSRDERRARPQEAWEALRRVVACHLPAPDWFAHGLASADAARRVFDKIALAHVGEVVRVAGRIRDAWEVATQAAMARRARLDAIGGVARVVLRAWREVVDDVPAGTAKWEQRWGEATTHGHGCALARRLAFGGEGVAERWVSPHQAGWVWLLLAYQRLVGAGRVRWRRVRSETWRRTDAARRRAVAGRGVGTALACTAPTPADAGDAPGPPSARLAAQAQRRRPPERLGVQVVAATPAARRKKRARDAGDTDGTVVRRRRHDGQLRYTARARDQLELWIGGAVGGWTGPRKGDG